jgi:sugar phosphate isomerase/epimerase
MGWVLDDLRAIKSSVGYAAVADAMASASLEHVEVELASEWWKPEHMWRESWEELLEASDAFGGAAMIKAGTAQAPALSDPTVLAPAFRRLGEEAAVHGTKVALEPLPFGMVASTPAGAELVRVADHSACGLMVDYWHIFRAGTSFSELRNNLTSEMIIGVELNDADAEPVGTLFEDTRDRRRYPGEGVQDVGGFIHCLRDIGYQGPWGIEILSDAHRALPLREGLRRAFEATEAVLQLE